MQHLCNQNKTATPLLQKKTATKNINATFLQLKIKLQLLCYKKNCNQKYKCNISATKNKTATPLLQKKLQPKI